MSNSLDPQDFTNQRNADIAQAVKGLFVINGGGALALLALFKDVWNGHQSLARTILVSIGLLVFGVMLAGGVHLVRYVASIRHQQGDGAARTFSMTYLFLAFCSLAAFILAMIWMTVGLWLALVPTPSS